MFTQSFGHVGEVLFSGKSVGTAGVLGVALFILSGVGCGSSSPSSGPPGMAGNGGGAGGVGTGHGASTATGATGFKFAGGSNSDGGVHVGLGKCGDGVIDPNEQCDDGVAPAKKTGSGAVDTGCSALCQIEANWSCPTPGQPCQYLGVCGNGVLTSNKQCDDGNTVSGDGCSATCQLESGWSCRVAGKPCEPTCGDGKVELGKECDTGNKAGRRLLCHLPDRTRLELHGLA